LSWYCSVWESERGKEHYFSRLETEIQFSISCTPLWSLVSLKPGRIRLWHFKKS
jgi:hypothetical protein